ncbi:MAG: hypothetical protein EZS28_034136 [Streblomastix strix]|uniref:Uncharacterized protein n=1 Tax=Streblomastix strix TaxID=222440 RepID=A0A5J4UIP8_9EUKA|nr:MAG: hypothetical protein EZS28_034136 [Streblomastix strix]
MPTTKNFIFHSMSCTSIPKRSALSIFRKILVNVLSRWRKTSEKMISTPEFNMIGSNMSADEMNERYARTILCVAGREVDDEQNKIQKDFEENKGNVNENGVMACPPIFSDIFLFEVNKNIGWRIRNIFKDVFFVCFEWKSSDVVYYSGR